MVTVRQPHSFRSKSESRNRWWVSENHLCTANKQLTYMFSYEIILAKVDIGHRQHGFVVPFVEPINCTAIHQRRIGTASRAKSCAGRRHGQYHVEKAPDTLQKNHIMRMFTVFGNTHDRVNFNIQRVSIFASSASFLANDSFWETRNISSWRNQNVFLYS